MLGATESPTESSPLGQGRPHHSRNNWLPRAQQSLFKRIISLLFHSRGARVFISAHTSFLCIESCKHGPFHAQCNRRIQATKRFYVTGLDPASPITTLADLMNRMFVERVARSSHEKHSCSFESQLENESKRPE